MSGRGRPVSPPPLAQRHAAHRPKVATQMGVVRKPSGQGQVCPTPICTVQVCPAQVCPAKVYPAKLFAHLAPAGGQMENPPYPLHRRPPGGRQANPGSKPLMKATGASTHQGCGAGNRSPLGEQAQCSRKTRGRRGMDQLRQQTCLYGGKTRLRLQRCLNDTGRGTPQELQGNMALRQFTRWYRKKDREGRWEQFHPHGPSCGSNSRMGNRTGPTQQSETPNRLPGETDLFAQPPNEVGGSGRNQPFRFPGVPTWQDPDLADPSPQPGMGGRPTPMP